MPCSAERAPGAAIGLKFKNLEPKIRETPRLLNSAFIPIPTFSLDSDPWDDHYRSCSIDLPFFLLIAVIAALATATSLSSAAILLHRCLCVMDVLIGHQLPRTFDSDPSKFVHVNEIYLLCHRGSLMFHDPELAHVAANRLPTWTERLQTW